MIRFYPALLLLFSFLLASCAGTPSTEAPPETVTAAPVQVPPVQPAPEEEPDPETVQLQQLAAFEPLEEAREISLRIFPADSTVAILDEGRLRTLESTRKEKDRSFFATAATAVLLRAEGYESLVLPLDGKGAAEAKLERPWELIRKKGETETLWQPKSVRFAFDGQSVFVANLGEETAISQYSVDPPDLIRHFQVPEAYRDAAGFVETAILPGRNEIWLSQMTLDTIHVFNLSTGEHLAAIKVSGSWPKVLLASEDETRVYVSCWDSNSVVEIDTATRKETRSLSTGSIPRGLAFAGDGDDLLVALFGSSGIDRINLMTGRREVIYDAAPGASYAMRHIIHDPERGEYYITAMGVRRVYRLSEDGRWLGWWSVGDKPNTCEISPDGSRLFISCRGPNNPDTGYLNRGYEFGKIYVINLEKSEVEGWIWGRDQCTGLDVSPDGSLLAFSNFLTPSLELYEISR